MVNGALHLVRVEDIRNSEDLGKGLGISLEANTELLERYYADGFDDRIEPGTYVAVSELIDFLGDNEEGELEQGLHSLEQEIPGDVVGCMQHFFADDGGADQRRYGIVNDLLARPEMRQLFADVEFLKQAFGGSKIDVPEDKPTGLLDPRLPAFDQLVDYVELQWIQQGLLVGNTVKIYRKKQTMYLPFDGRVCASEAVVYLRPDPFKGELVDRIRGSLKNEEGSEVAFFDQVKNELPGNKTSENGFAARAILYFDLGIRLSSRIHKAKLISRKVFYDASYELVHAAAAEKKVGEFGTGNSYYVSSVRRDLILPLVEAVIERNQ